jgi:ubiquinone biosynthesis protein UbiJ
VLSRLLGAASGADPATTPGRPLERLLNAALNRVLALDSAAMMRLARLEGRTLAIRLRDRDWHAHAVVQQGQLELRRAAPGAVDVTITGRVADFVALARANRRGEALGAGRVEIMGDLAIAQDVQALLAELDIDWDEWLAGYVGDVAAHRLGRAVRGAAGLAGSSARRLEQDLGDYLRHELELVPLRPELEAYGREVYALADAVERAAARVRRLRERAARP